MSKYQELYNAVLWQNDIMQDQYTVMRDSYSSDQRRVDFIISDIAFITHVNFYLWILYYLVASLMIYFIFLGKNKSALSMQFKVFLLCSVALYPMIITTVELWLYYIVAKIGTLLFGIPFRSELWDKLPKFSLLAIYPPGVV